MKAELITVPALNTMLRFVLPFVALLLPNVCYAGPFGLDAGMSRAEVIQKIGKGAKVANGGKTIFSSTVPIQNDSFISYEMHFDSNNRLTLISALSKAVPTEQDGTDLLYFFQTFRYALEDKYGKSPMVWNDDGHVKWTECAANSKKICAAANWYSHGDGSAALRTLHLGMITLEAFALNKNTGYVELTYVFDTSTAHGL